MADDNEKLIELANLVKRMRSVQKEFFQKGKTMGQYERTKLVYDAKKLETEVDEAIENVLNPKPEQGKLFPS